MSERSAGKPYRLLLFLLCQLSSFLVGCDVETIRRKAPKIPGVSLARSNRWRFKKSDALKKWMNTEADRIDRERKQLEALRKACSSDDRLITKVGDHYLHYANELYRTLNDQKNLDVATVREQLRFLFLELARLYRIPLPRNF